MLKVINSITQPGRYFVQLESSKECIAGPFAEKADAVKAMESLKGFNFKFDSDGLVVLGSGPCKTCGNHFELYDGECIFCKIA